MRSGLAAVVVVAVGLSLAGCERKPRYCDECAAIKALQAKPGRTAEEDKELKRLKDAYREGAINLSEFHNTRGKVPDLHPDCDCPCHLCIP